ncbi:MAG TPA: lysophospholipid acyltransferase family protein [Bdellovibrionota bacterium]|nr:lysophospholipid acyltransferase family protein [Bdellovibrionota bacterium]
MIDLSSLVKWALGIVATVIGSLLSIFVLVFDRDGRYLHWSMGCWARWCLAIAGLRIEISGLENVKDKGPYVVVANHQGQADILVISAVLPFPFLWVAKKELFRIPLLGFAMKRAGFISLDRSHREKAIQSMGVVAEKVRQGKSVVMFPEGTRSRDGKLQPFKRGAFHLAAETGASILPVMIQGSFDVLPKGSAKIRSRTIKVRFFEPINSGNYGLARKDKLQEEVWGILNSGLAGILTPVDGLDRVPSLNQRNSEP